MAFQRDVARPSGTGSTCRAAPRREHIKTNTYGDKPMPSLLDKEHSIAGPHFNRWLVPPAALAIHLCIGMAYGFSVFWLPLSKALGIGKAIACTGDSATLLGQAFATDCDWKISSLSIMYTLFFVFLGSSAAIWGGWLEHAGPRKAGVVSALCWCGGLVISAFGVKTHQLWLMWLGSGVIGGIGLGLGYISPVSTLIKWFPDRRGMATGMAIMGFGGGAMIGSPLADMLMKKFATPTSVGVYETFLTLAAIYVVFMLAGAMGYRVPPSGWAPKGWTPPSAAEKQSMITHDQVHLNTAWKTPQFWLIWAVLMLNVSATIGIIGVASPMIQEIFGGHLIGVDVRFTDLSPDQKKQIATVGAAFAGLFSLFNIAGRFFWASISDKLGRKLTYTVFFVAGTLAYFSLPNSANGGNVAMFVAAICLIASMYGGGFATVPAYLADMFGTQMVGAIHGRLLTAWSVAGIVGPVLVTTIRESQQKAGIAGEHVYDQPLYLVAGLLVLGLVANLLVRPVDHRHAMSDAELAREKALAHERATAAQVGGDASAVGAGGFGLTAILAWSAVCLPLAWGVMQTVQKVAKIF
jgi:MFS family permease